MWYNTSVINLDFPPLPNVTVDQIAGFLEALSDDGGPENLSTIAHRLVLDLDDLLPMVEAVKLLGFIHLSETEVTLTAVGKRFADATITRRKLLFREQVIEHAPLIAFITGALWQNGGVEQDNELLLERLRSSFSSPEAKVQFATAIDWGRYAELFE